MMEQQQRLTDSGGQESRQATEEIVYLCSTKSEPSPGKAGTARNDSWARGRNHPEPLRLEGWFSWECWQLGLHTISLYSLLSSQSGAGFQRKLLKSRCVMRARQKLGHLSYPASGVRQHPFCYIQLVMTHSLRAADSRDGASHLPLLGGVARSHYMWLEAL